jgi:enterochelin esterase-like enzyme
MNIKLFTIVLFCSLCFNSYAQTGGVENIVGTNFLIKSEVLSEEREIQVYLPDGYTDSDRKYPVLYILDGQRLFLHGVSLQKSFAAGRQTPEFIVVGITNKQSQGNINFSVRSK